MRDRRRSASAVHASALTTMVNVGELDSAKRLMRFLRSSAVPCRGSPFTWVTTSPLHKPRRPAGPPFFKEAIKTRGCFGKGFEVSSSLVLGAFLFCLGLPPLEIWIREKASAMVPSHSSSQKVRGGRYFEAGHASSVTNRGIRAGNG
eukprot:scaffold220420_cov39-Attheya_sp.AAC.1